MKKNLLLVLSCLALFLILIFSCTEKPENTAISSDGVKISFSVSGEGSPALVFIPGWGNNRSSWDSIVPYFSQKYKVVTIDLAGYGGSGNNREKWDMASFGKDVVAVINKLHLKNVVLIGHSMGAVVIIETAKVIPEKITGLVIEDDMHNVEDKYSEQLVNYLDSVYMNMAANPTVEKYLAAFNNPKLPLGKSEDIAKKFVSMIENVPKIGWSESLKECFRWYNEDCIESLKMIQIPIIAINSDQPPTNVEVFKKYHPSFEVKIIPNVTHLVHYEAPEKFNLLLEESIQEFLNASKK
jgi:pimeloyl-ACP methyl ester carboxylesterase